ncbi:MAG: S24 family peptidase [Parasphingorhabdus sp.]|jgi:phage repressor protein C with HTH and peptisase S24 domain|nr:S24 family peptidase [Parasphingorhabdus sp.]
MELGIRIKARMDRKGLSQHELARRVGISQAAIHKLISGQTLGSSHLHKIARELDTTVDYLTGEIDDPDMGALRDNKLKYIAEPDDPKLLAVPNLAAIPQLDIAYSMGGGAINEFVEPVGQWYFTKDMLRPLMKGGIEQLFVVRASGDSMIPTMINGDLCIVDRAQDDIDQQDRIWAVAYGDLGMIKRVRKLPNAGYQLNSDNAAVSPIEAHDGEMHVIGRVIWIGRAM